MRAVDEPGDYSVIEKAVWAMLPNGVTIRVPTDGERVVWGIEEHDDGTVTLTPSINLHPTPNLHGGWHGFLRRGVWSEA